MKRWLIPLLALTFLLSLGACSTMPSFSLDDEMKDRAHETVDLGFNTLQTLRAGMEDMMMAGQFLLCQMGVMACPKQEEVDAAIPVRYDESVQGPHPFGHLSNVKEVAWPQEPVKRE